MGGSCCKIPGDEEEDHGQDENKDHLRLGKKQEDSCDGPESPSATKGRSIECCICLEPVTTTTKAILNPCVHSDFHESCISSWAQQKKSCPLCDKEIDSIIYEVKGERYKTKTIPRQPADHQDSQSDQEIARQLFYTDLFYPHLFDV